MLTLRPLLVLVPFVALQGQSIDSARVARPERPTVATHAFAVAPGYLELEAGVARSRDGGDRSTQSVLTAKYGLAPKLQLTLTSSVTAASPGVLGADPIFAGVKWQLNDEREGHPTFAVLPGITLSNGPRRDPSAALSLTAVVSHDFGPVAMDLNVAATRLNDVQGGTPYLWTASFGGALTGPFGWGLEAYRIDPGDGSSGVQWLGYLGVTTKPWIVWDVGVIGPVAKDGAHAIFAGVTWNVGRPFRR